MLDLISKLTEKNIPIENILLDPNNPRFIGKRFVGRLKTKNAIPENKYTQESVQVAALEKMMHEDFDITSVRNSIINNGFLPLDKIVVRPIDDENFVVVEGNRRIAAIKTLLTQVEDGEIELKEDELTSIQNINVLVLDNDDENAQFDQWLLQGIRHLSGIKDWGPYQKATLINQMFEKEKTPQEIAESLGMTVVMVNRFNRTYNAIKQMEDNDEFGQHAGPALFTHFEEAIRIPKVKEYLGWSEGEQKFLNEEIVKEFYSWIVPQEELNGEKKFPRGKDVGYLARIIDAPSALEKLRQEGTDINEVLVTLGSEEAEDQWKEKVTDALKSLKKLNLESLEKFTDEDLELINKLAVEGKKRFIQASAIKKAED